jgi:hypothetical protein
MNNFNLLVRKNEKSAFIRSFESRELAENYIHMFDGSMVEMDKNRHIFPNTFWESRETTCQINLWESPFACQMFLTDEQIKELLADNHKVYDVYPMYDGCTLNLYSCKVCVNSLAD